MSEHTDAMAALRRLDDESITCRRGSGIGHAWRPIGYWQGPNGETRRLSECARDCGTEKVDRWNQRTGERFPATYRYAEGYSLPEQPQAFEVRMELIRRARVFSSEEAMLEALTEGKGRLR